MIYNPNQGTNNNAFILKRIKQAIALFAGVWLKVVTLSASL